MRERLHDRSILPLHLPHTSFTSQSLKDSYSLPFIIYTSIAMTRSLQALSVALLVSSVTSAITAPSCHLQTVPTNSPAENFPTYCSCDGFGLHPTTTIAGMVSPTGDQLCRYPYSSQLAALPTIAPIPFTCNVESATAGFTVPNTWCGCTAGQSTSTYSTKFNPNPGGSRRCHRLCLHAGRTPRQYYFAFGGSMRHRDRRARRSLLE